MRALSTRRRIAVASVGGLLALLAIGALAVTREQPAWRTPRVALPPELDWDAENESQAAVLSRMEAGYAHLARDEPAAALNAFRSAAQVALFEEPNELPWVGEAEALCRVGRKAEGRAVLADFTCTLDLWADRRTCESMEVALRRPHGGPGFPTRCYVELCFGEIVRGYLDEPVTEQSRRILAGHARVAERAAKVCKG